MFTHRITGNELNDGIERFYFPNYILDLIDTMELNRAKEITQTGFTYFSYPGSKNDRKIHLIGTAKMHSKFGGVQANISIMIDSIKMS